MLTTCGPVMAEGDVNQDGRMDLFVGGTQGNAGKIFLQTPKVLKSPRPLFLRTCLRMRTLLFSTPTEIMTLICMWSAEDIMNTQALTRAFRTVCILMTARANSPAHRMPLPEMLVSKSCIAPDRLRSRRRYRCFCRGSCYSGRYPVTPESFMLRNSGGRFENMGRLA